MQVATTTPAAKATRIRKAPKVTRDTTPAVIEAESAAREAAKLAAEQEAWLAAMRIDWQAEKQAGAFHGTLEAYLDLQRVDPSRKERYTGRMLALVEARKAYVKGANGNAHTGDFIGTAFAAMTRDQVIATCVSLLGLPGNPYLHLNPGQQSMNLRNKVRGAMQRGEISAEAVRNVTQNATALVVA